ncbi:restriction endonuclease subunit S [Streptomyces mirabilis]|uniref:restriction endonuclease subunit S n=1 Tax=Streptomyces mirabilis TaxID=68239 RepID=UPI00365D6551
MRAWSKVTIGELGRVVTGATPRTGDDAAWGDEVDFITPTEMSYSNREPTGCRRLSREGLEPLMRRFIPAGSVLFTCIGFSTGKVARISRPAVTNQQVNSLIPDPNVVDALFAYYLLRKNSADIRHIASGSTTPIVNKSTFQAFEVELPELPEQQAIAAVLGALDDKIAVNERIAATARQLGVTYFGAAIESGSTPMAVDKLAAYLNRGQAPRYTDDEDGLVVLNQKCIRGGSVILEPARKTQAGRVHAERRLAFGDVLVNSTGVGTLGRIGIWSHQIDATVDSHVTIVRINHDLVPPVIGGFAMLSVQPIIEAMGEGSTGQTELSRTKLGQVEVRLPDADREGLASRLISLETRSHAALRESDSLATLRDTLLPQLMSGKLRVRDAERIVEDAV